MMLCLKCKYAYNHYSEVEEETLKQLVEQQGENYEEWKQTMDATYSDVITRYPIVKFCIKRLAWVVGNPDRPTQTIRQCEHFQPQP